MKGFSAHEPAVPPVHSPSRSSKVVQPLLWLLAIGCAAASLAGVHKGWAYYHKANFLYAPLRRSVDFKIWVGWVKGTDSIRKLLHAQFPARYSYYLYLRDVVGSNGTFGQVWGGIMAAVLCLSILAALACLFMWARGRARATGVIAALCSFFIFSMSCVLYTVEAVAVSRYTKITLGGFKAVCRPDWAFWTAIAASLLWLVSAILSFTESRKMRTQYPPTVADGKAGVPMGTYPAV